MKTNIIIMLLLLSSPLVHPQTFPKNLGIEIGAGYNQLFWGPEYGTVLEFGGKPIDRTHFSVTPEIRLTYRANVSELVAIYPFLGYNRFGGSSGEDVFWFDAPEAGSFILVSLSNWSLGAGAKINLHAKVHYHTLLFSFEDDSRSNWFSTWSEHLGVRTAYTIAPVSVAFEAWFGLNNLSGPVWAISTIHQNHYRVLLGYTI